MICNNGCLDTVLHVSFIEDVYVGQNHTATSREEHLYEATPGIVGDDTKLVKHGAQSL
jgi:hypothetical protein